MFLAVPRTFYSIDINADHLYFLLISFNVKMTARLNAFRYVIDAIDYEGKSTIKTKPWNIDMNENRIKIFQVSFENLSKEQYDLLNHIKQMF